MTGDTTAYAQQHQMIVDWDNTNPLPKKQVIVDLEKHIANYTTIQDYIILVLGANEELISDYTIKKLHSSM